MKNLILYMLFLPCLWISCMEDKGSYDYVDVNEITIDTLKNKDITIYNTLEVPAKVTCSMVNSELEYLWYRYINKSLETDTLSLSDTLRWKVNVPVGSYDVYLKVTDVNSGLSAKSKFTVNVTGKFDKGLMVLGEDGGKADLIFINVAGDVVSVYESANSSELGHNPVIVANTTIPQGSTLNDILLLCDDGKGGKVLTNADFSVKSGYEDLFYVAPLTVKPQAYYKALNYGLLALADYMISDGKLHTRTTDVWGNAPILYNPTVPGDYMLSPYAIVNGAASLFYDNKNKRFVVMKIDVFGLKKVFSLVSSGTAGFDPADVGLEMVYMAEGASEGNIRRGFGIFRNNQNQLQRLIFSMGDYSNTDYDTPMKLLSSTPVATTAEGIDEASGYATSLAKPFMYYSKGSKVYLYELENNICVPVYDVDTIPDLNGSTVDKIYMEYVTNLDNYGSKSDVYNKTLYVASSTNRGSGKNGTVHILKLGDNGTVEERTALYKNVCARTVSMCYKR